MHRLPVAFPIYRDYLIALFLLSGLLLPLSVHAIDDPSLAVKATQYQELIRSKRDPAGQSTAQLQQQAERLVHQKNGSAATERYEAAIVAGDVTVALWLDLARTWQTLASHKKSDWRTRYNARQRSQQAAWNALELARVPYERARALFLLGTLYDKSDSPKKAIAAYREGLELEDNPQIAKRYKQLDEAHAFRIKGVEVESNSATPKICLKFSDDLAKNRQLHYQDYLQIQPTLQPAITARGEQLCVEGVTHGQSYTLTVRAGIPSAEGEKTRVKQEFTAKVEDREPTLGFRGTTYILPKVGTQHLPLTSVNLETAKLRLLRINDRNVVREIQERRITRMLDGNDLNRVANQFGEQVWEGVLTLVTGKRNQEITTAVPVSKILQDPQPGIYIVAAERVDKEQSIYSNRATQWLIVSDIGLFTMRGDDGLHVFTRSLATAQPLAGIELKLYARNNGELGQITTDEKGYARLDPGLLRGDGGREPAALMAFGKGDYNVLDLTKPAFDLSDRGVAGRAAPGAVDAFLYTERGVYRPGETVELMTLLRNSRANALPNAPLMLKVFRPDTVEMAQMRPTTPAMGGYHARVPLPLNARTGTWTVKAYTDPKGKPVGQLRFQVEDFVPQRLKLELETSAKMLKPNESATLDVSGRFLYGAPAANLKTEAEIVLREDPKPYPDYSGYRFGLIQDEWTAKRFPVVLSGTNAEGKAQTLLTLNETPDTTRPLLARLRVSLFEPGGRPVNRSLDLPYRVQPFAIGIKPHFEDGGIEIGQSAQFDVVALDPAGQQSARNGLRTELVREDYRYYWYHKNGRWNYKRVIRDSAPVSSQTLNLTADQTATIQQDGLEWGHYRLEVLDPSTGVASSVRFTVGWFGESGESDTPDQMKVTLDKPRYQAGETAKVFLRAPFAGEVLLNVVGDRLWQSQTVSVPTDGATVELAIPAEWSPGAYITATAFRPADQKNQRGPGRAIGVAWVGLDPALRTLNVKLDTPKEWTPRQTVEVPVTVTGIDAGQSAYLTLAAVDEGILQLTDFTTPDPAQYFLGKRRLAMQLRDLYGKLIETGGRPGQFKVGGGAGGQQLNPSGTRTVKTVALFSGAVALDANGQARIPLQLPDFNGQLRLMAVAWDQQRVGHAEAEPLVRDPLVARVYVPRFLAPKDESHITVTLQNLNAPAGDYQVRLSAEGAVAVNEPAAFTFTVADSAQQNQESHRFTLRGLQPGDGKIRLQVDGTNGFQLLRESDIGVRAAQTVVSTRIARRLNPAEPLRLGREVLADYLSGTAQAQLSVSSRPNLNVPELLEKLDRYPYGCLEQTTSRALPLLYFNEVAQGWAGKNATELGIRARVQEAIQRILGMQDAAGGFGRWSANYGIDNWLSAYAMDFLVRAREAKYLVPETAYQMGLKYLQAQSKNIDFKKNQLGWYAYQLSVLARVQKAAIGNLRYLHDNHLQKLPTALAQAQLGASLARYGELGRAKEAFTAALNRTDRTSIDDYGSDLRDRAALLTLLTESGLLPDRLPPLADQVATDFNTRRYTSTQEQAWLLLAAHALLKQSGSLQLAVDGQMMTTDPFYRSLTTAQLEQGLAVVNQGQQAAWYTLNLSGVLTAPQPPAQEGFSVSRRYYNREGKPIDATQLRQNELLVVVITGNAQGKEKQQALVVDLLPAGLEIENVRLAHTASSDEFSWLPTLTSTVHTEFRDDRFVAALDLDEGSKKRTFTLAYLVRVVTPGIYQQPAVYVEDMYKPWQFGRGIMGTLKVE